MNRNLAAQAREPKSEIHRLRLSITAQKNALANDERKVSERRARIAALEAEEAALAAAGA